MPAQYLLPCPSCNASRTIDATQCGLTVDCGCGAKMKVPTFRALSRLQRAAAADVPKPVRWGAREGMIVAGGLIAAVGLGLGLFGYLTPDITPQQFVDREMGSPVDISNMKPTEVMEEWHRVGRAGLGQYDQQISIVFETENRIKHVWTWVALGIGALGVLMIPAAFVLFAPRRG